MASLASSTVSVSKETSESIVRYLEETGESGPGAMTRFVEDAIARRLFDFYAGKVRAGFSDMSPEQVEELADEAIAWARSPEGRACE